MLSPRNEDRRSLFTMIQTDKALADELLYMEGTLVMMQEDVESFSMAMETLAERFQAFNETLEKLYERVSRLTESMDDRLHALDECERSVRPDLPF